MKQRESEAVLLSLKNPRTHKTTHSRPLLALFAPFSKIIGVCAFLVFLCVCCALVGFFPPFTALNTSKLQKRTKEERMVVWTLPLIHLVTLWLRTPPFPLAIWLI